MTTRTHDANRHPKYTRYSHKDVHNHIRELNNNGYQHSKTLKMFLDCYMEMNQEAQQELDYVLAGMMEKFKKKNPRTPWGVGTVAELLTVLIREGYL